LILTRRPIGDLATAPKIGEKRIPLIGRVLEITVPSGIIIGCSTRECVVVVEVKRGLGRVRH
jgi:hypothetical protein